MGIDSCSVGDINRQSVIEEKYEAHRYITFIYTKVEFQDACMLLVYWELDQLVHNYHTQV